MADPARRWLKQLAALGLAACGSEIRTAPLGLRPAGAPPPVVVEYPPPPAQVEKVGDDPGPPHVWVDGQWEPGAGGWEWQPGGWYTPPAGCHFAPPSLEWRAAPDGRGPARFHHAGRWYSDDGSTKPCDEAKPATAR